MRLLLSTVAAVGLLAGQSFAQTSGDGTGGAAVMQDRSAATSGALGTSAADQEAQDRAVRSAEGAGMRDVRILDRVFVLQGLTPQGETVFMIVNPPGALIGLGAPTGAAPAQTAQRTDPCTQNWTTVDSDASGTVSETEAKAVADAAFARIDVDKNGMLSLVEWERCGDPALGPGSVSTAANVSGGGAGAGASAAAGGASVEGVSANTNAGTAPWSEDKFSSFDTDRSGDLSADEAAEASRAGASADQADEDAARRLGGMFARVDADGDGTLSAEEWSARNRQTFNDLFARVDGDNNGEISQAEWRQYREEGYGRAAEAGQEPGIWRYYFFVPG